MASQLARKKLFVEYKPKILQLEDMGFTDRERSFQCLSETKGNMQQAIQALTLNPGNTTKKPLSAAKSGVKGTGKEHRPKKATGLRADAGLPDLLVSNDDVFNLDSVGDLLNDDAFNPTPAPSNDAFANLMGTAPAAGLMQPAPAAGLMQPSNTSIPTSPAVSAPASVPYSSPFATGAARMQQQQQMAQGAQGGGGGGYQSAFTTGGARQMQQQQQPMRPTGPTIGGLCNAPAPGGMGQPGMMNPGMAPPQSAAVPGLLQPSRAGMPASQPMRQPAQQQWGGVQSQPQMSMHQSPPAQGLKLPPGSLSAAFASNTASAAPAAASPGQPAAKKGFGGLLADMKQTL